MELTEPEQNHYWVLIFGLCAAYHYTTERMLDQFNCLFCQLHGDISLFLHSSYKEVNWAVGHSSEWLINYLEQQYGFPSSNLDRGKTISDGYQVGTQFNVCYQVTRFLGLSILGLSGMWYLN